MNHNSIRLQRGKNIRMRHRVRRLGLPNRLPRSRGTQNTQLDLEELESMIREGKFGIYKIISAE